MEGGGEGGLDVPEEEVGARCMWVAMEMGEGGWGRAE